MALKFGGTIFNLTNKAVASAVDAATKDVAKASPAAGVSLSKDISVVQFLNTEEKGLGYFNIWKDLGGVFSLDHVLIQNATFAKVFPGVYYLDIKVSLCSTVTTAVSLGITLTANGAAQPEQKFVISRFGATEAAVSSSAFISNIKVSTQSDVKISAKFYDIVGNTELKVSKIDTSKTHFGFTLIKSET